MYFDDLSEYRTDPETEERLLRLAGKSLLYLNVGWLSSEYPYPIGHVDSEIADYIKFQCFNNCINRMAGGHRCDICYDENMGPYDLIGVKFERYTVLSEEQIEAFKRVYTLMNGFGSGEIMIVDGDRAYMCPQMIIHYIAKHGYRPPDVFIDAVRKNIKEGI